MMLIGFICYFITVGFISFFVYQYNKKNRTDNYSNTILGNRSVNYFLTALSAQASDMSDWLFMAFPAAIYGGGLINAWIAIGLIFGMFITWNFIAAPLRKQTEIYNSFTLSSYFENHFNDTSGILRLVSAIMSLLFFAVYIAAGLKGFGFLSEAIFDLPYLLGVVIAIISVVFYMLLGGYKVLAWIDCFQALFLLLVIFIVPVFAFTKINGLSVILENAYVNNISLSFFPKTCLEWINTLLMTISWSVGYFGTPHILTKFMGINDVAEIKKAKYIGLSWQILVLFAAGISGFIAIGYFPIMLKNKELAFVFMVKDIFNTLLSGFILSAVVGATLSVMTAQMLVIVSIITEDFYKKTINPLATERQLLFAYRLSIIIISILSFFVSLNKAQSIQSLVQYAWIGLGCSFGPIIFLALYSKNINKNGAFFSILSGGSIAACWQYFFQDTIKSLYYVNIPAVFPGFIISIILAYGISYITKK